MQAESPPSSRPPPRIVPTLTEVVPDPLAPHGPAEHVTMPATLPIPLPAAPASPPAPAADPTPDAEALLRALGPALEARIDAAIAGVLHEQLPGLQSALQRAVAAVVHDAVAGARAQHGAPTDTGRYP